MSQPPVVLEAIQCIIVCDHTPSSGHQGDHTVVVVRVVFVRGPRVTAGAAVSDCTTMRGNGPGSLENLRLELV